MKLRYENGYYDSAGNVCLYSKGTLVREATGAEMLEYILGDSEHEWSIPGLIRDGYVVCVFPDESVRLVFEDDLVRDN